MTPPQDLLYDQNTTKLCSVCKEIKLLAEFVRDTRNKDKHGAYCKQCERNRKANIRRSNVSHTYSQDTYKTCSTCLIPKKLTEFFPRAGGQYGVEGHCNQCRRRGLTAVLVELGIKRKVTLEELATVDPDVYKKRTRRWKLFRMGVNEEWYRETLEKQDGKCAICEATEPGGSLVNFCVDHNHYCCGPRQACERCLRGLLCFRCNVNLSFLENPDWTDKAIAYLNRF